MSKCVCVCVCVCVYVCVCVCHLIFNFAGYVPADSVRMKYSEIPSSSVIVVLVAVLLSVVFAAGIAIASFVHRNNKLVIDKDL